MSSHFLSCECQDVKIAADKTFGLYLFIGGNHISGSTEGSVEHNNKRTIYKVYWYKDVEMITLHSVAVSTGIRMLR